MKIYNTSFIKIPRVLKLKYQTTTAVYKNHITNYTSSSSYIYELFYNNFNYIDQEYMELERDCSAINNKIKSLNEEIKIINLQKTRYQEKVNHLTKKIDIYINQN